MSTLDLAGQAAIVTGSGRGLGLAMARALAKAGAAVVINDVDDGAARAAVESITAIGGKAVAEVVPVGGAEAADRLVARALDSFGRLDTLVANAGILRDRVLWNMSDDEFDAVIHTHLRGTFTCVRSVVRHLREAKHGGRLVLVSSIAGTRGNFGQTNYSAAKAGITGFTRTWALECAKAQITCNAIVPIAMTRMLATIPGMAPYVEAAERGEPIPGHLRRLGFGTPEDVAALVVFLASAAADNVTGQCIGIGGDKLSLWSHPQEVKVALHDGGWTPGLIAESWKTSIGQEPQTYGDDLLKHLLG